MSARARKRVFRSQDVRPSVIPPSTGSTCPVIDRAKLEQSNATAAAISSAVWSIPIGIAEDTSSSYSARSGVI